MVRCSKRTCYHEAPAQRILEYDDEQEDFDPFGPDVEGERRMHAYTHSTHARKERHFTQSYQASTVGIAVIFKFAELLQHSE